MMADMRTGLGCLIDLDDGAEVKQSLVRLEQLLTERLTLTQALMDS